MKLNVTSEWLKLPYESGTVENYSSHAIIELSNDKTAGILLKPHERYAFDDMKEMYIRSCNEDTIAGIVSFTEATYTANAEQIGEEVAEHETEDMADKTDVDNLFG